jgi:hypothetical protein
LPFTVSVTPFAIERHGNLVSRQLFMVCGKCNGGWMKILQDELKPILSLLIRGDWNDFSVLRGKRIALWAAMTASVIAMSYPETKGVTRADRLFIKTCQELPKNWYVWIGRCSGAEDVNYCNRIAFAPNAIGTSAIRGTYEANVAITTIILRQVLLHVVSVPSDKMAPDPVEYGRELSLFPIRPWGGAEIDWRWIPILPVNSPQVQRIKDELYYLMGPNYKIL